MSPLERNSERVVLPFDRGRFARDALDATVAYLGVEHAPPGASRTRRGSAASIRLETTVSGRVVEVGSTDFTLEHRGLSARFRHLLPAALGLDALLGTLVSVECSETLHRGRCTVDARIRDERGTLVLWAHDGELPEDRTAHGLALRVRMVSEGRGLAIAHRGGLSIVRGPELALVESDERAMLVIVMRTGDDDVAFVAIAV